MQNRRKTISLSTSMKINLSYKKVKKPITKMLSSSGFKKNNLIRLNSKLDDFPKKKTQSILINDENMKLSFLKSINTKEKNNMRKSLFLPTSKKITKKKYIEDKYLKYMKNQIYERISKQYSSHINFYSIIKRNNTQYKSFEYTSYYNYYLICNLIDNKKFKFHSDYIEYLYLNNNQEYLISYFAENEIYIIMNYLLYIVYANDIATKTKKSKRILKDDKIKYMFNNLVRSNYNFTGSIEIMNDIGVYYKNKESNHQKINNISNLDNVKPINNETIVYKYIKDIPRSKLSNCIPNYYKLGQEVINCLKDFTNRRKFIKIDKLDNNNQFGEIKQRKNKRFNTNENILKGNILRNISFSLSKDLNSEENKEKDADNKRYKSSKRRRFDCETNDIETFLKNIGGFDYIKRYINNNDEKNIIGKRNKKTKSMININFNFIKNKKNIFLSSKREENKVLKKEIFLTKIFKNTFNKIEENNTNNIYNYNKNNKEINIISNSEKNKYQNIRNILLKNFEKIKKSRNHIRNINDKVMNNIIQTPQNLIKFNGFSNNTNKNKKILNKNKSNIFKSNNSIKEVSSDDSLIFYKIKNSFNFASRTNKNKYTINKFISLRKLNSFSPTINSKPKKYVYQGGDRKPFSSFSSMSLEDKEINVWENNKIDTDIINVAVKSSYLLNKIGKINEQKFKSFHNFNTLEKLIKYPMIYSSNYN